MFISEEDQKQALIKADEAERLERKRLFSMDSPLIHAIAVAGALVWAVKTSAPTVKKLHDKFYAAPVSEVHIADDAATKSRSHVQRLNSSITLDYDKVLKDISPSMSSVSAPDTLYLELQKEVGDIKESTALHGIKSIAVVKDGTIVATIPTSNVTIDDFIRTAQNLQGLSVPKDDSTNNIRFKNNTPASLQTRNR